MMQQLSEEWFAARAGKVTASRLADVMARTKTGYGAGRKNYMAELVAEILTGEKAQGYTNAAMQWGIDTEPEARAMYELMLDTVVEEVGFIVHPTIDRSGASPDGLVGSDGMVEIKCPNTATHIDTLLTETVPDKYVKQMMWQMACCDREWNDFVSYDPRMPAKMQFFCKRIYRDNEIVAEMEAEVNKFIAELEDTVQALRSKYDN